MRRIALASNSMRIGHSFPRSTVTLWSQSTDVVNGMAIEKQRRPLSSFREFRERRHPSQFAGRALSRQLD
jgi:hypothetical protein